MGNSAQGLPPLPPGYRLQGAGAPDLPPLPPGYTIQTADAPPPRSLWDSVKEAANNLAGGAASSLAEIPAKLAQLPGLKQLNAIDPTRKVIGPAYARMQTAIAPPDPNSVAAKIGAAAEQSAELMIAGPEEFGVNALREGAPRIAGRVGANAVIAGTDAALHGQNVGAAAALGGGATAALEAVPAVAPAVRDNRFVSSLLGPRASSVDPVTGVVRALRARNTVRNFPDAVRTALPDVRREIDAAGIDPQDVSLRDFLDSIYKAKASVYGELEDRFLGPNAHVNLRTDSVADAIEAPIHAMTPMGLRENAATAQSALDAADQYRGNAMTLRTVDNRIKELNNELGSAQATLKVKQDALMRDPAYAPRFAELNALRDLESDALTRLSGPGSAALKQRYGALKTLQDVTERQVPVIERQAAMKLYGGLGTMGAMANMAEGGAEAATGHLAAAGSRVARGMAEGLVGRNITTMNDPEWLLRAALSNTKPTAPYMTVPLGAASDGAAPQAFVGQQPSLSTVPDRRQLGAGRFGGPVPLGGDAATVPVPPVAPGTTLGRTGRNLLGTGTDSTRTIITPEPQDTNPMRLLRAKRIIVRDPKTGKMKRVYLSSSEDGQ